MAKTIMTFDDSASIRQMVVFTLKQGGYEVIEAKDGQEALAKLNGSKPDMIITDLNMPNLDGIGLIRAVRSDATRGVCCRLLCLRQSHRIRENRKEKQPGPPDGLSNRSIRISCCQLSGECLDSGMLFCQAHRKQKAPVKRGFLWYYGRQVTSFWLP